MSFKNIYVGQTVKKIVEYMRLRAKAASPGTLVGVADEVERGMWKIIELPKKRKGKKK